MAKVNTIHIPKMKPVRLCLPLFCCLGYIAYRKLTDTPSSSTNCTKIVIYHVQK